MAEAYLGEIRPFAGNYAPEGWQLCDGSLLSVNTYQELYSLIGTTYGGNGTTTFGVPDLRGRLPVGEGQGTGLTNRTVGQEGGTSTVQLTDSQMPLHTHNFQATSAVGTTNVLAGGGVLAETPAGVNRYVPPSAVTSSSFIHQMASNAITPYIGRSGAHANVMPYLAIQFIICLNGVYPTRQ
jgi:microcystin-dependent protein